MSEELVLQERVTLDAQLQQSDISIWVEDIEVFLASPYRSTSSLKGLIKTKSIKAVEVK